jgi:hypothetical protein
VQYDAILLQRPRFADAHLGRAYALFKLGRLDDAKKALAEGERLGANPNAISAQRRAMAQADRRAEPDGVGKSRNNEKPSPQDEPAERAAPPANETQKPPVDELPPTLPEAAEPN